MNRNFTVKYGSKTIGVNEFQMDAERGKLRVNQSVENFTIDFDFILLGTSVSNLENETNDLEEEFKKIRQDVEVKINGVVAWSFNHDDNTGYNSRATISKTGGPKDGGLSRTFHCHIDVGLPFEDPDLDGRRSSQVSIAYSPIRRISLNISGEYACQSAEASDGKKSALENYHRAIEAYITSIKTLLGNTAEDYSEDGDEDPVTLVFERVAEDYSYDDQNKILNFSISEQEVIYKQGKALTPVDDPDIFNQSLNIMIARAWPGDAVHAGAMKYRITKATAQYSCLVKKDLDNAGENKTDLEAVYFDKIKPFLLDEINNSKEFQGDIAFISTITEESVSYDKTGNAISATLSCDILRDAGVSQGGGTVLQKSLTITDDESMGQYLVPVWSRPNQQGGRLQKYLFQGPGSHVRRITSVYRVLNGQGVDPLMNVPDSKDVNTFLGSEGNMDEITPAGADWVLLDKHAEATVVEIGTPPEEGTRQYTVTDYTLSTVSERYVKVEAPAPEEGHVHDTSEYDTGLGDYTGGYSPGNNPIGGGGSGSLPSPGNQ